MHAVIDILRGARARLADPARWCTGVMAETAQGKPTRPCDEDACRWCFLGALVREAVDLGSHHLFSLACSAVERAAGKFPSSINDNEGHAAVLEALDGAILDEAVD